jgi:uncharacterized protein
MTSLIVQRLFSVPQQCLIAVVRGYRLLLSPWLGSACRFTPTCSAYALDALTQRGAVQGSYLTLARLVRCHPWCAGGHDPVPPAKNTSSLFTGLLEKAGPTTPSTSVSKTPL